MEKVVYSSKYVIVKFDKETGVYISEYLPETANMLNVDWKKLMKHLANLILEFKPLYIIDDNRNRFFAYPPDLQEWTLHLFISIWNKIGLKKYVQINSKDLISKLSGEQIEEMANTQFSAKFKNKFVDDMESAVKWINE